MIKKVNYLIRILLFVSFFAVLFNPLIVRAASASISASKTTAYVGDKVTITVKTTAGAWNLKVSGSGINDSIVGYDMDGNKTTTKTYTLNTSKAGKYTITLTGDITDYDTEQLSTISKSVTVTITAKPKTTTDKKNTTKTETKTQTKTTTDTKTTTKTEPKKEVVSEITRFEVVGYDIDFKKDVKNYEIEIDEKVKKLYVIVEGKNITVTGNKEVDINDKNEITVKIKETKGTNDYTIKINRKVEQKEEVKKEIETAAKVAPIKEVSNNNNIIYLVVSVILAIIVGVVTVQLANNRKQ